MKPSRRPEVRAAKYARKNSVTVSADLSGLDALLDGLGDDVEAATRPAAQAAAQVLYEAARFNVRAISRSGALLQSIYQAYSQDNSGQGRATYHVSWNASKAPHAHLVEHGYLQRYEMAVDDSGRFVGPRVRPEMIGTRKPGRRASQSVKDAYYVTLPTPIQVPAKAFMRRAADKFPLAYAAAEKEILNRIYGVSA